MGKYFSLGEYNKQYKYIWIYLSIRFVSILIFDNEVAFTQLQSKIFNIPYCPFITIQFDYIGFIIITIILITIINFSKKKVTNVDITGKNKLIYEKMELILFSVKKSDYFLFVNLFFVVVTDMLEDILFKFEDKFNCYLLNYWMFEMLFFEFFNSKLMKTKLYRHHICSLIFILTTCSIMQTVILILSLNNNSDSEELNNNKNWLIP